MLRSKVRIQVQPYPGISRCSSIAAAPRGTLPVLSEPHHDIKSDNMLNLSLVPVAGDGLQPDNMRAQEDSR